MTEFARLPDWPLPHRSLAARRPWKTEGSNPAARTIGSAYD